MASRPHRNAHRQADTPDIVNEKKQWQQDAMNAQREQSVSHDDNGNSRHPSPSSTTVVLELRDTHEEAPQRTVYQTLSKDFDGPVARYVTVLHDRADSDSGLVVDDGDEDDEKTTLSTKKKAIGTDSNGMPTAIEAPQATKSLGKVDSIVKDTDVEAATTHPLQTVDIADITKSVSQSTASSTSAPNKDDSEPAGLGAGAKAGIAFGALGGLLLIGLLVFFCISRRKKNARQQNVADDEKSEMGAAPGKARSYSETHPHAPRLSLRPVTQFFANGFAPSEKRQSKGAAMALTPTAAADRGNPNRLSLLSINAPHARPGTAHTVHSINPFSDSQVARGTSQAVNPFGNHAERVPSPVSEVNSMYNKDMPPSPMSAYSDPFSTNVGAPSPLDRKTSMRRNGPQDLDLTVPAPRGPPSPTGTVYSDRPETPGTGPTASAGAAAIAAAGGPVNTSVHRVQLDFGATLEDEMNLKAGELVRLLHEYDDGWALCIRLDRSRQGVVPRTCLSTRPVKPRAPANGQRPGPPINPQGGRGPPVSMNARARAVSNASTTGRPISPRPVSPMSQASRPGTAGRPHSPAGLNPHGRGNPGPSPMSQHQRLPSDRGAPGQAY